jgi:hypothetical protein
MLHEKKQWCQSSFVTLTYDNDHLPLAGTLVKRDFQLFMKRLRFSRSHAIRFYACGEYGETTRRPHYHAILFNCGFPDALVHSKNNRGELLYTSADLGALWDNGQHLIGDVTFASAAYVARYCVKKVSGEKADEHYSVFDADGVIHERLPEFALMSRRPGIGSGYYSRFGQEVRDHDTVVVDSKEVAPPRFYDTRTQVLDDKLWTSIRRKRKLRAVLAAADNTVDRRRVKEIIVIRRLQASNKFRSA